MNLLFAPACLGVGIASIAVPWRHRAALGIADPDTAPEGRSAVLLVAAAVVWLVVALLTVPDPLIRMLHASLVPAAGIAAVAALAGSHRWPVILGVMGAVVHGCLLVVLLGAEQRAIVPIVEPIVAAALLLRALPVEFGAVRRVAAL